jgi:ribose 5-phosphate isomerase B
MKIAIGSDHAGVDLKRAIMEQFPDIEFINAGTDSYESCDYPDYISQVGAAIQSGQAERGIVICGSGIGASIVANKMKGIRAALCFNGYMAEMSRRHNNANVLAMGARVIGLDIVFQMVDLWLTTEFEGGRHERRINKIADLEESQCKKQSS